VILLVACNTPDPDTGTMPPMDMEETLESPSEAEDLDPGDAFQAAITAGYVESLHGGTTEPRYAYDGQVPGPTFRVPLGQPVTIAFTNALDDATTIHWHGMEVPEAMDGAGWVDGGVASGETFTYSFTPTHAGTFWYHPHLDVASQVDGGLYGTFIVEDPDEPVADRELVLVFDVPGEHEDEEGDTGETHHSHHDLPDPDTVVWTVNGHVAPTFHATAGERIRVRTVNASNTGYLDLTWPDMRLIAEDQGLLSAPEAPTSVRLVPGDRAEFEWDVSTSFDVQTLPVVAAGGSAWGATRTLMTVDVDRSGSPTPIAWPDAPEAPTADPGWTDLVYVFEGGDSWYINGETWPDVTPKTTPIGEDAVVEVRNLSTTNHPFHLHGNRFEVLSVDGVPPSARRYEDTVDVGIRSTVRLLLHPDNPGDWLLHCHLLGHEADGMMTILTVE
jgi:FtsP/CotA-like multicopper oxidase with cupredoxin domain